METSVKSIFCFYNTWV